MKVVSIHQPTYFPWIGLMDKVARSDIFVILDCVQYNRRSFQNRTLYFNGTQSKYLTIPVSSKNHQAENLLIKDVTISDTGAAAKHYKTLWHRYHKSPGWHLLDNELEELLHQQFTNLIDLCVATMKLTFKFLNLTPRIYMASELSASGTKGELMLNITKRVSGDVYLSGEGAREYMSYVNPRDFDVSVVYQKFTHPTYKQSHADRFHEGCFALECFLEEGGSKFFRDFIERAGYPQPRCLK